jgi:glycosyltransferase involved in cell wall biosynthesis
MLVACASLRRHKGVHLAIEALGRLPTHHVLWVTGDVADPMAREYVNELEALTARTGVAGRVHFIGARRDVHGVMAAADLVVVPSVWEEPFGLVAAEAQILGVPVIASSRGALPELMGAGRFGLVFEPDPAALAAAITRLAADAEQRAALARAAWTHAAAQYSYQRWSREVAAVLMEVAGAPLVTGDLGPAVARARSA